jgi:hypothetical protein
VANKDRITGKYICSYCLKQYDQWQEADNCRDAHDLLYVQISKQDLNRLIMFLTLKDDSLLTKTLVSSLYKYKYLTFD